MKPCLLLIMLLSLIGCSTQSHIVDVPVPLACPTPHIPPKPELMTAKLTGNESPDIVQKAEVADLRALTNYSNELIAILKGYEHG